MEAGVRPQKKGGRETPASDQIIPISYFCEATNSSYVIATPDSSIPLNTSTEIDSVEFYEDLSREYGKDASYIPNSIGIAISAPLTVLGTIFVFAGIPQASDSGFKGVGGAIAIFAGLHVLGAGLPILLYNIRRYHTHKKHAEKRDEYKEAAERYKTKRNSTQIKLVPSIDLANAGAGINATILF